MESRPRNRSGQFDTYLCVSLAFAAATISLLLRCVARRITKVPLCYDDAFAFIAYFFAAVWAALMFYWLRNGLGLLLIDIDLPTEKALDISRFVHWSGELVYASSLAFSRLSILGFYWRLFKTSSIRVPIQVLAISTALWLVLRTLLAVFHCVPIEKFWHQSLLGRCDINDSMLFVATAIIHLIFDLKILSLPIIEVRKLQLPKAQRIGIAAMFGFGIFVCASSVMVIAQSWRYDSTSIELPRITAPIFSWVTAEINFSIVSANLPILRPIYLCMIGRPLRTTSSRQNSWPHAPSRPITLKSSSSSNESPIKRPYSSFMMHFSGPSRIRPRRTRPYSSFIPGLSPADPAVPGDQKQNWPSEKKDATKVDSASDSTNELGCYHGNQTIVTGPVTNRNSVSRRVELQGDAPKQSETNEPYEGKAWILVTNETVVRVSYLV